LCRKLWKSRGREKKRGGRFQYPAHLAFLASVFGAGAPQVVQQGKIGLLIKRAAREKMKRWGEGKGGIKGLALGQPIGTGARCSNMIDFWCFGAEAITSVGTRVTKGPGKANGNKRQTRKGKRRGMD